MRYIQGNKDSLKGKAVIFVALDQPEKFAESPFEMSTLAVFCAAGEVDLLELIIQVMQLPREHGMLINRFYKRYFQEIEEIKRSFPERISNIIEEVLDEEEENIPDGMRDAFRTMFNQQNRGAESDGNSGPVKETDSSGQPSQLPQPEFYSTMVPLPDISILESHINNPDGPGFDIIDLEREESSGVAHLLLDAHSRLYIAEYMNQSANLINLDSVKDYSSPYKNMKNLGSSELKNALTELSSELMFRIETGENTERIFADLKKLTAGSHLMGLVVSLYNISTTKDPNRFKLMDLYFRKIFSLIDEDYMLTKELTEEIEKYSV
jgi:hypothetical protein